MKTMHNGLSSQSAVWIIATSLVCAILASPESLVASSFGTDVLVLLDSAMESDASGQGTLRTLAGGARIAANELAPTDRISFMTFSRTVKNMLAMTKDVGKFESAAYRAAGLQIPDRYHHLYDSLWTALQSFPESPAKDRRRRIIVITNTSDAGSSHTEGEVIARATLRDVAIFVALVSRASVPVRLMPGGRVETGGFRVNETEEKKSLAPLAQKTGGEIGIYIASPYVIPTAIENALNK